MKMFIEYLRNLPPPSFNLKNAIRNIFNQVYNVVSKDECSKYSIPLSYIEKLRILSGMDREFVDSVFQSKKIQDSKFFNNPKIELLFTLYIYFMIHKDDKYGLYVLTLLAFQIYHSMMSKYFSICNNDVLVRTIASLRSSSAAKKSGTIGIAMVISYRMHQKYFSYIHVDKFDEEDYRIKFISELRHRINQALKNIAKRYYEIMKSTTTSIARDSQERMAKYTQMVNSVISYVEKNILSSEDPEPIVKYLCSKLSKSMSYKDVVVRFVKRILKTSMVLKESLLYIIDIIKHVDDFCSQDISNLYKLVVKNKKVYLHIKSILLKVMDDSIVPSWDSRSISYKKAVMSLTIVTLLYIIRKYLCQRV